MPAALTLDVATTPVRIRVNKGEDFNLTVAVLDATGANMSLVGWTAVAQIRGPGPVAPLLYEWSAARSNMTTTALGAVLAFKSVETGLWAWSDGEFELDVTSPAGARGIVATGPFTAVNRLVAP